MSARSYAEQYERMKRWYRRLKDIDAGKEHPVEKEYNTKYYEDEMYALFQNCYHLKDWLKNDPNIRHLLPNIENLVEDFANKGPICMRICGDLCNGSKHMILIKPKIDKNTQVASQGFRLSLGQGPPVVAVSYEIQCRGQSYDAKSLAESCISEWDNFMTAHNIPIP